MNSPVSEDHVKALRAAVDALERQPKTGDPRCFYCLAPATLLCDGKVGWIKADPSPERWDVIDTSLEDPLATCDRPLCRDCATLGGMEHTCGRSHCGAETFDYCRDCEPDAYAPLMTAEEAAAIQRRRMVRPHGEYDGLADLAAPLKDLLDALSPLTYGVRT